MITRSVRIPGFFYVNKGAIGRINEILAIEGVDVSKSLIVSGKSFTKSIGDKVEASIDKKSLRVTIEGNGSESIKEVEKAIRNYAPSVVVGVGGGKVLDVTKFCAYKLNKSFLAVPTVLSNDGISSPVAVIENGQGLGSMGTNPPIGIIVDVNIIKNSPRETILAGIGDLISNISAVDDWNLASIHAGEKVDKFAQILAKNSAEGFVQLLLRRPDISSLAVEDESLLVSLAEGLIQSGIAMSLAGSSRPCSGSEHLISHALDGLLDYSKPHGLQVGFATLFTTALRRKDISDLVSLFRRIGFPATLQELGITVSTFLEAIKRAPSTRKGRFTILNLASDKEICAAITTAYGS